MTRVSSSAAAVGCSEHAAMAMAHNTTARHFIIRMVRPLFVSSLRDGAAG
jgi:hypothetical protein